MRKNKLSIFTLYLFFLLSFFFHLIKVNAFLDEDLWLDLYNNIESGIYNLELKYYETNITNWWTISIAKRINNIAWSECIDEAITMDDFNKIALWNTEILNNFILDECKDNDKWSQINISLMNNYFDVIIKLSKESQANAEEKTKITYNIARLWLYSDWNIDNSPYDIIKDLEDINWIIFSITNWDETIYKGTDTTKLSNFLNSYKTNTNTNTNTAKSTNTTTNNTNITNSINTLNWYTCIKSTSNNLSWLNYSTLNNLIGNIEDNWNSNYTLQSWITWNWNNNNSNQTNNNGWTITTSNSQIW